MVEPAVSSKGNQQHNQHPKMMVSLDNLYLQDALDELTGQRQEVRPEDVERLAPLRFSQSMSMATYHFVLPESVAQSLIAPSSLTSVF